MLALFDLHSLALAKVNGIANAVQRGECVMCTSMANASHIYSSPPDTNRKSAIAHCYSWVHADILFGFYWQLPCLLVPRPMHVGDSNVTCGKQQAVDVAAVDTAADA